MSKGSKRKAKKVEKAILEEQSNNLASNREEEHHYPQGHSGANHPGDSPFVGKGLDESKAPTPNKKLWNTFPTGFTARRESGEPGEVGAARANVVDEGSRQDVQPPVSQKERNPKFYKWRPTWGTALMTKEGGNASALMTKEGGN